MRVTKQAKREAKQLFRLCLIDDVLDENRAREVAQQVAKAGARDGPAVLAHLLRLVKMDRAQRTAEIESAAPLPADLQATIESGLARRYGQGLTTTFNVHPALIGGVRIRVGSHVYDDSVRARLAALEQRF
jgi:F-type H+-transporting ATPase subunit delta